MRAFTASIFRPFTLGCWTKLFAVTVECGPEPASALPSPLDRHSLVAAVRAACPHGTLLQRGMFVLLALLLAAAATPCRASSPSLSFSSPVQWTKLPVKQGSNASTLFTLVTGGSFSGKITLSVSGLPSGVTASWSSSSITPSSGKAYSTLTLAAASWAKTNYYQFSIKASGDGISITYPYAILVEPAVGDQIAISHPSLTIYSGSSASLSVSATPIDGIKIPSSGSGTTAMITSKLPDGISATWSKPTVSGGVAHWTLTMRANDSADIAADRINFAIKITDSTSGTAYTVNEGFTLLVELVASISVGSPTGKTIPTTFMGLSHEWGDAQFVMGYSAKGTNTIYRQLLANLTAFGSGHPNLRIGGNSTDATGEPDSTTIPPLAEVASATGSHFELGVNLGDNNVGLATDQATAYMKQMPSGSVLAIEIGNEPDWYHLNGLRPSSYSVQDYYDDFDTWKAHIMPKLPSGLKLMGASWAITSTLPNISTYEGNFGNDLALCSQHFYVTNIAADPPNDILLYSDASKTGSAKVAAAVVTTHSHGIPFRIGELGAVAGGGIPAIGESFSAALWSIDTMFEFANVGVDGVNWETTTGNYNTPFLFSRTSSGGKYSYALKSVNPLYYGLLFFQEATGKAPEFLTKTLSTQANIKAWAITPQGGTPRVVIINKDKAMGGTIEVKVGGYTHASVLRLTAPSYTSSLGVMFAGQTFDGSRDGKIQGNKTVDTIDSSNGDFHVTVPTTSAVLLIFSK